MARLATLVVLLLALASSVMANDFTDDLKARRARLMEQVGPDSMVVLFSAPSRVYSRDVDYEYRQDSDLYYLTGLTQSDLILVLMPGNRANKEILFVRPLDPRRDHWTGHSLTIEEASAKTGIARVLMSSEFDRFIANLLSGRSADRQRRSGFDEYRQFLDGVAAGRARLGVIVPVSATLGGPLSPVHEFVRTVRDRFIGVTVMNVADIIWGLRQVKTPYERRVLRLSAEISGEAHRAGMRTARPGAFEYEVEAAIEAVYLKNGAMSWGYPSIVASGPNATTLHYSESSRRMENGDLLLVDAGANYQYQTADITRTFPVNGAYTPRQRDLYELVLAAQDAGMKVAKSGNTPDDIEEAVEATIKQGLLKLGLIVDPAGDEFRTWYTARSFHFIGIDVHDVGRLDAALAPGMAFVIEPGLYVREHALDSLPKSPESAAFIEKVRAAVRNYASIGVRVEDSFLLSESGLERLSSTVPRTVTEIESFMKEQRISGPR